MHGDEAVVVGCQPRSGEPRLGAGRSDPQHLVELVDGAGGGVQNAGISGLAFRFAPGVGLRAPGEARGVHCTLSDAIDPRAVMNPHSPLGQHSGKCGADSGRVVGQHLRAGGEQLEAQPIGIASAFAQARAQSMPHREHHLDAAGTRTHHADPHRSVSSEHPSHERVPSVHEVADRLDRHHRALGSGHVVRAGCGADVDGEHVIGHRRSVAAHHPAFDRIEPHGLVVIEARVRESGQGSQIDVDLVVRVVPRDVTREHSRVGRFHVAANERDPDPRHRLHSEALEHDDVAVPAADEHEILDDRGGGGIHGVLSAMPAIGGNDGHVPPKHTEDRRETRRRCDARIGIIPRCRPTQSPLGVPGRSGDVRIRGPRRGPGGIRGEASAALEGPVTSGGETAHARTSEPDCCAPFPAIARVTDRGSDNGR